MHSEGHAGLTLIIFSFLMMPFGYSQNALILIVMAAGLSSLPDIDLKWKNVKHRGYSHSIGAALIIGLVFGAIFFYGNGLMFGLLGFLAGFGGTISHLIGDLFTYMKFPIFWPISDRKRSWGWFGSKENNEIFLKLGCLSLVLYVLVTNGFFQEVLSGAF